MVHIVGISGPSGNVGQATLPLLVAAAQQGKIKLVILHRAGHVPSQAPVHENIELRAVNYENSVDQLAPKMQGINVFISCVGFEGIPYESKVVEALSRSPALVTYIPCSYSATWSQEELHDPALGPILNFMYTGMNKAKELGLSITTFYTGVFDLYWFEYGFIGAPLKDNTIWANSKQLANPFPITVMEHLGAALARVATSDPTSIKGQRYSVVTFSPTGNELVELYTKLNGEPAKAKDFTDSDRAALRADTENNGAIRAGYWDHWAGNTWAYEATGVTSDKSYQGPSLEEVARRFL